jgi:hypothetical protein
MKSGYRKATSTMFNAISPVTSPAVIRVLRACVVIVTATLTLIGCASSAATGPAPAGMTKQAIMLVLARQQRVDLTADHLQGEADCREIRQGRTTHRQVTVSTSRLVVSNNISIGLMCSGRTTDGEERRFVAQYRPPEPAADQKRRATAGIGITIQKNGEAFLITDLMPGGPAADSAELHGGVRLVGIAPDPETGFQPVQGKSLRELAMLIVGEPGTPLSLSIIQPGEVQTSEVTLTREKPTPEQVKAYRQELREKAIDRLVIEDNTGAFLSPYTSDGVVAEWVDKGINAKMGGATGSAVGAAAGSALASQALDNVPGGGLLGGILGSALGEDAGRNAAVEASGGEAYMRRTSDLSFDSIDKMAIWLLSVHGQKRNFAEVINATSAIYPELKPAIQRTQQSAGR